MENYQQALELAERRGDERQIGEASLRLGDATKDAQDFQKSIKYYEKALEIAEKRKDEEQMIRACLGLADSWKLSNKYQTSIDYYEKLLKIAKVKEDKQLETKVHIGLGDAFQLDNQSEKAVDSFSQALNIATKQKDSFHETEAYIWLGNVYRLINEFQHAIDSYKEALEIATTRLDERQQTEAYFGLGHAYKNLTKTELAIEYYTKASEISMKQKDERLETEAYFCIADGYRLNEEMERAREHYQKALEMAKKRGDMRQMTDAHLWLGHIYKSENQKQAAKKEYEIALEFARKQEDKRQEGEALFGIGDIGELSINGGDGNIGVQPEKGTQVSEKSKKHRKKVMLLEAKNCNDLCEAPIPIKAFVQDNELKIGKGSMGTCVYVGIMQDGREVAVKRAVKDACAKTAENELEIFERIKAPGSPYIVKYLNFYSNNNFMYTVLDLCEENLKEFIQGCSAEYLQGHGARMIKEIFLALNVLHSNGILHRDLKPQNVLVTVAGRIQLADFGISRVLKEDESSFLTEAKGTRDWFSPEVIEEINKKRKGSYKKKSDVHVAGMIAFFILSKGEHLFGAEGYRMSNILKGDPVYIDQVQEGPAQEFISLLTRHDIAERPHTEEALKHVFLNSQN